MTLIDRTVAWPGDRGGHVWLKDREVMSSDSVRVRYTVLGDTGPWVVLCAGFMCPDNFWAGIAPLLARDHRVIVLNYRSIGASTDPRPVGIAGTNLRQSTYSIAKMAEDVIAVMDAEDADDATLIGHSMGCQVALAVWRAVGGGRVGALSLVTGTHRSPFTSFYGLDVSMLFPLVFAGAHLAPRPVQKAVPRLLRLSIALEVGRLLRALGPQTPDDGMDLYFDHFPEVDPLIALRICRGMHEFDADGWLGEIDVPVQIFIGTKDTFTPPSLGPVMHEAIPTAELHVIEGGTHAAIIEVPVEVHAAIADFTHRHLGHAPVSPALNPTVRSRPEVA